MSNPAPGTLLGPFQIEGVIGAGSMGDVFRGVDTGLHRKVAIKILSEKHRDSPELRARFTREGRAVAAIQHPNVVQVFSTGTFDERPYIAMELLDGTDLGTAVEENGPLTAIQAARAILDAARGLNAAAKAGLIHRDVKPSNLVLLPDGRVKVTDFGLAKPVDPGSEPSLTALGVVVGTPDYIAPEQARGETIDERVDIYALGGTLYFLLAGIPPFRTGKPAEDKYLKVVARHLRQPAPDARTINPAADEQLSELARQLMAKKPTDRPDYGQLIARLEKIVSRLETSGAAPRVLPPAAEGSGGMVSKTPFVGGDRPHGFSELGGGTPHEEDDAAATGVRPRTIPPTAGRDDDLDAGFSEIMPARGGLPAWIKLLTVIAVIVFGAGLAVYLTRSKPTGETPGTTAAIDAGTIGQGGTPTIDARPQNAPAPTPPAGMLLVTRTDGTPWFFVDARPVSVGEFIKVFPKQKRPPGAKDGEPMTMVPYTYARAYAQSTGKRLIKAEEWYAVTRTVGLVDAPANTWEWVEVEGAGQERLVRQRGKTAMKPATGQPDVTFRLAQDLPASAPAPK